MHSPETKDLVYGMRGDRGTGNNPWWPEAWEKREGDITLRDKLKPGRQKIWLETYPPPTPHTPCSAVVRLCPPAPPFSSVE